MSLSPENETLFARACDGLASAQEIRALEHLLRTSPDALDAWLTYSSLHAELTAGTPFAVVKEKAARNKSPLVFDDATEPKSSPARSQTRPRSPWTWQAAAGLVVGLFAASVVWAYVIPSGVKSLLLLDEDFESADAALAVRTALETGIWRGDAAEIVGPQDGLRPERGQHMMRFLRADFDGRSKPSGGHIAVAYRLIDLRPVRAEIADGGAVVEVSASFNARAFPEAEKYSCAISLYALDADAVPDRAGRLGTTLNNEALAMARSNRATLDRDPATWQRLTTELRVPSNAEYLVVRLHINQLFESTSDTVFTGSYVDDVRVTLVRRAPLR
jgi:hypothetical protein